ncbi:hypothetical protein B0T17DRAFT_618135 [Bombardia bombarda]|uniref:DUF7053 domain-containing protein n=1 Tax=Bombardia bombarda TaxID=252184 RepID=A0AA39WU88_9PEZI|nr:hypothetical protein B0T17DRAFT_618135 [Bombardia bombarda]
MASSPSLTIITRVPLPAFLDPRLVLESLHTFESLIVANPLLKTYERRAVQVDTLVDDPFFHEDGQKLSAFVVTDRVPIIPGVGSWATKDVVIPCVFQSFEHGVRCRADAQAGVTVRSSYEVRPRGHVEGGPAEVRPGDGDYELVEIANIDCGSFVKAFVKRSFTNAHQDILQRVVDDIARRHSTANQ